VLIWLPSRGFFYMLGSGKTYSVQLLHCVSFEVKRVNL
jgi:hypothetical protein